MSNIIKLQKLNLAAAVAHDEHVEAVDVAVNDADQGVVQVAVSGHV